MRKQFECDDVPYNGGGISYLVLFLVFNFKHRRCIVSSDMPETIQTKVEYHKSCDIVILANKFEGDRSTSMNTWTILLNDSMQYVYFWFGWLLCNEFN